MNTRIITLVLFLSLITGCASNSLKKEAFTKPKNLAVVTVMGSVHGLATSDEEDKALLKALVDISFKELGKSKHIRLQTQNSVLAHKNYKAIKDDGPVMGADMAAGYKRFDPKAESKNLKAIAKSLNVDGFVFITAGYGTAKSGMSIGGLGGLPLPISAGSTKAEVNYILAAVDSDGEPFWTESVQLKSEDGVTTVMGVGNVQSLQTKIVDLTQAASREVIARLDQNLSSK